MAYLLAKGCGFFILLMMFAGEGLMIYGLNYMTQESESQKFQNIGKALMAG
jgi:hypothetical protein